MDQNNPARFLDTAYNAYKSNPGATNQILQAAAQGAPVGLRGLAAAAAQQSQQQAQQAMAALQQQGPQPNVIQKLATQGIMSQMDTGLPIAQPMPEEAPQMMATGGLVAFADGGSVLPPDVIEAIQSHFAEGGAVHGYAEGETVLGDIIRELKWRQLQGIANEEELAKLSDLIRRQHLSAPMIEGLERGAEYQPGFEPPSYEDIYRTEAPRAGAESKIGRSYSSLYPKAEAAEGYTPFRAKDLPPEVEPARYSDLYRAETPNVGIGRQIERSYSTLYPRAEAAAEYTPFKPPESAPTYEELYRAEEPIARAGQRIERSYSSLYPPAEAGAEYSPFRPKEPTLSMVERMEKGAAPYKSTVKTPTASALEKLAQAAEYSPETVKKAAWTGGEGFRGFKMPDVKVPEPLKKLGRLIEKNPELLMLTDPRVRALAGLHSGAGKMLTGFGGEGAGAEEVLSGLASLREEGAFPLSVRELLPKFAEGGDVRGYATGEEILRKLTGPQESFGQRAFGGLLNLLSSPDEPNRAITREELEARKARPEAETYGKEGEAFKGAGLDISESPAPTPKAEVHPEGKKVTPEFKKVALDTSSTATGTPTTSTTSSSLTTGESMGIPTGAGGLEGLRDMMMELRGHKTMTPAVSKELEDLRSSARTSTILQSLLGGLGAGLSSPYGGRFALGKAALGSLAGYQKGIGSEEEIGRKAFDVLRGYEDAPAEEKAKAMEQIMDISKEKLRAQSAQDLAELRGTMGMEKALAQIAGAKERANIMAPFKGVTADVQVANLIETMTQNEIKEDTNKEYYDAIGNLKPGAREAARQKAIRNLLAQGIEVPPQMLQSGQAGGLGGAPLGSQTRIYN